MGLIDGIRMVPTSHSGFLLLETLDGDLTSTNEYGVRPTSRHLV